MTTATVNKNTVQTESSSNQLDPLERSLGLKWQTTSPADLAKPLPRPAPVKVSPLQTKNFRKPFTRTPEVFRQVSLTNSENGRRLETIMVKFTVPESMIPKGIIQRVHVDQKRMQGQAFKDKGIQAIVAYNAQVAFLRRGLATRGWLLADAHYFSKPGNMYCVALTYTQAVDKAIKLSSAAQEDIRALARTVWNECYIWDNCNVPEFKSITVNCRHSGDSKLKNIIAVRGGNICCLQRDQLMVEGQE